VNDLPVVFNPAARGGRARLPRERLEQTASRCGYRLLWWETAAPGHAADLAARAVREGFPLLAAWGGDGTYNEVARGLMGSETAAVLLPGGTTSVLVYELGIPRQPDEALRTQLAGTRRAMSVGRTNRGQIFLLMLSVGPDALILERLPGALKSAGGKLGITAQAFLEFTRARLPRFTVVCDGIRHEASWCIVGNARSYAGPFLATPGADPFTPGLEAVVLTRHGRRAVVPFFFGIPTGRHLLRPGVERFPVQRLALEGPEDIPYQLDGDPAGHLPVEVEVAAERMWVMTPPVREVVLSAAVPAAS
jgi:diacylglycerol kinase (ATP)